MLKISLFVLFFIFSTVTNANAQCNFEAFANNNSIILINHNCKKSKIDLPYELIGFEVNCKKTRILSFGKTLNLNPNNPQDSIVTILNIKNNKMKNIMFPRNVYNVFFSKNQDVGVAQTVLDEIINLNTGKIVSIHEPTREQELCDVFNGKSYRKYKE